MQKTMYQILVLVLVGFCATFVWAENEGPTQFYDDYIQQKIEHSLQKTALIGSRSANLRTYAEHHRQKAMYLNKFRSELVQALIGNDIRLQPHAVEHFLNQAFMRYHNDQIVTSASQ